MSNTIKLIGRYVTGWGSASRNWDDDIAIKQKEALPSIDKMYKGTFNLKLIDPPEYVPNDIAMIRKAESGSCISRTTKVTRINDATIEAFIYNGGWPKDTIELISKINITKHFGLRLNDTVTIELEVEG